MTKSTLNHPAPDEALAQQIGRVAHDMHTTGLPPKLRHESAMRVLDCLGNSFAAANLRVVDQMRTIVSAWGGNGQATAINATVPLANMFGYINNLRSSTQGRAQYTMQFSHYDKVPQNVQDEVTKKLA